MQKVGSKRKCRDDIAQLEEEGIMEWDQYDEYFKELTKEHRQRLIEIRQFESDPLPYCSEGLKKKALKKLQQPLEKEIRGRVERWISNKQIGNNNNKEQEGVISERKIDLLQLLHTEF